MKTWRYMELEKIQHLLNEGRILLGHYIYWTEKRDGSCLAVWMKEEENFVSSLKKFFHKPIPKHLVISSRNREKAEGSIAKDFWNSEDRPHVAEFLRENQNYMVFGELLRNGLSPTRMEKHEKVEYIVFDIFDGDHFLNYQQVHQFCYHYGMKCVRLFGEGRFTSMESLYEYRDKMFELCKQESREGVVLKTFTNEEQPLYAKEKLDTATPRGQPKLEKGRPVYPPLSLSEAMGAVDKAYADLGEKFATKREAMPLVASYIKKEMEKHMCCAPEYDFYRLYCDYCKDHHIEQIVSERAVVLQAKVSKKENKIITFFRRFRKK